MTTLLTVGHGTLTAEAFASLLDARDVGRVVDVRSFPGSRHNPQFGRDEMERWVPAAGIGYSWMRELGGRRRPVADSKHVALRNDAFRAYADYMETPAFLAGVDDLLALASERADGRDVQRVGVVALPSAPARRSSRARARHRGRPSHARRPPHSPRPDRGRAPRRRPLVYDVGLTPPLPSDAESATRAGTTAGSR